MSPSDVTGLPRLTAVTLYEEHSVLRAEWHDDWPLPLCLTVPPGTVTFSVENAQRLLRLLLDNVPTGEDAL